MDAFGLIVCNLPGDASDAGTVIAAARCGAIGLLNCAGMDSGTAHRAMTHIRQAASGTVGIKLDLPSLHLLPAVLDNEPRPGVWIEVASPEQAAHAVESGCDGVIARGLPLAVQLAAISQVPVWVAGIVPGEVMACRAAGISGVVIEQAPLADAMRSLPVILRNWREVLEREDGPGGESAGGADAVMLQFQQLMTQFLQTQAAVMTAYFENAAVPAAVQGKPPEPIENATRPGAPDAEAPAGQVPDCLAELRQIASESTGYPAEMLDPDAAIETDLGIDSARRGEILSRFQNLCPLGKRDKIQAIMSGLCAAGTLREIAERIAAVLPCAGEGRHEPAGAVPRFVPALTARPRRPAPPEYYPGRISIITDDETGIAAGIAEELNRAGERAILLRHNPDTVIGADDLFTTDLTDVEAIESTVGMIRQEHGPIGAIIHLLPLRGNGSLAQCGFAQWQELVRLDVYSLYALARAAEADLRQTGRGGGALFVTVTGRGGDFGLYPGPNTLPTHFAAADFTKAAAREFPDVLCKVVDLDAADPLVILQKKLIEELTSTDEALQVGLPGDRRLTLVAQAEPAATRASRAIQRDWVVLITGGGRGITAEVARQIAGQRQPVLVIAGASPLPVPELRDTDGVTDISRIKAALTARLKSSGMPVKPAAVEAAYQRLMKEREIHATLEALHAAGARVEYCPVDVRDEAVFGGLIERIYRDYGRLDVVIHGAGIADDKLIRDKTPESFSRVMATKADSTFVLSRKLRPETLQCLMFMSSIAPAFGSRAGADYAAANGILNGFAAMLQAQWPGRVVAMNWGPWDHSGISEEIREQLLSHNVQMISPRAGVQAALQEIECGQRDDALLALGEGPWAKTALPAGTPRLQVHAFGGIP